MWISINKTEHPREWLRHCLVLVQASLELKWKFKIFLVQHFTKLFPEFFFSFFPLNILCIAWNTIVSHHESMYDWTETMQKKYLFDLYKKFLHKLFCTKSMLQYDLHWHKYLFSLQTCTILINFPSRRINQFQNIAGIYLLRDIIHEIMQYHVVMVIYLYKCRNN